MDTRKLSHGESIGHYQEDAIPQDNVYYLIVWKYQEEAYHLTSGTSQLQTEEVCGGKHQTSQRNQQVFCCTYLFSYYSLF